MQSPLLLQQFSSHTSHLWKSIPFPCFLDSYNLQKSKCNANRHPLSCWISFHESSQFSVFSFTLTPNPAYQWHCYLAWEKWFFFKIQYSGIIQKRQCSSGIYGRKCWNVCFSLIIFLVRLVTSQRRVFVFLNLGMRNELLHFKYPPNTRLDIHPSSTLNRNYLPACKSYC